MKKALIIVVCIMLVLSIAIPASAITGTTATKVDTSKKVTLQFYMVLNGPSDLDMVMAKVNALALKDINAEVKFNYTTSTDFRTKYSLLLSTGQPIDMIYTAPWLTYKDFAAKGAFKPLDTLLPAVVPDLVKSIPAFYWNATKVDGKIYTVPNTWRHYTTNGIIYRKDFADKYNLPVPNTIANFEAYMDGVKKNVPSQVLSVEYVNPGIQRQNFTAFETLCAFNHKWVVNAMPYGLQADYATPSKVSDYWNSPAFIDDMKIMKRWADKGYWSRSALSTKADPTAFDNGKCATVLGGANPDKYGANVQNKKPDWSVGYVPYSDINGIAQLAHPTQDSYGCPVSGKNTERALMFFEKLCLDKTYNHLTEYGIEGVHYNVDKDGYWVGIGDPTKSGFPREGMNGWAWRSNEFNLFPKSFDAVKAVYAKMDAVVKGNGEGENKYDGFSENTTAYAGTVAALGTVCTQYLAPLQAGLVPDIKNAVATFLKKANAAGLKKCQAEYIKQWTAYCKAMNY